MYKKESTEYDDEYVQKYDEDLNTTLIFVRFSHHVLSLIVSPGLVGRPVLRSQLSLCDRCLFEASTRSQ